MGKIVAIGGGRYSDGEINNILEYILELSDKENPVVSVFPTAAYDNADEFTDPIPFFKNNGALINIIKTTGRSVSVREIEKTVLNSDIIYVLGGNLEFLMKEWVSLGIDKLMKKAFADGIILSGYSSGSMCWFKRGYDDCGPNGSFVFCDGTGILPFCNCVHYESDDWQSFTQRCTEQDLSAVALDDGSALVYNDGKYALLYGADSESSAYYFDSADSYKKTELKNCSRDELNELLYSVTITDNRFRRDAEMAYIADGQCMEEVIEAREKFRQYNLINSADTQLLREKAYELFGKAGKNLTVIQPFFCDYGKHIEVGDNFFSNYGCTILDVAKVKIGNNVLLAPNVAIYTAGHPIDYEARNSGYEYGISVTIGDNCWIGGNTVITPGVTIGDGCVIGAGSVVTKDIPPNSVAVGNPCRVLRKITQEDKQYYFKKRKFDGYAMNKITEQAKDDE